MIKKITKYLIYLLTIMLIAGLYLTYFGIETKNFNQLIKDELRKNNINIDLEIKKVKLILKPRNFTVALETQNLNIRLKSKIIKIEKIETNLLLRSFIKKKFAINNFIIKTKKNNLEDLIDIARIYNNRPELFFINRFIERGHLTAKINVNFDQDGKIKDDFKIEGKIENLKLRSKIDRADFDFTIYDKEYNINNIKILINNSIIKSKKIIIKDKIDHISVETKIDKLKDQANIQLLNFFIDNINTDNFTDLNVITNNEISMKISKKLKLLDLKVKSKINLKNLKYNTKIELFSNFFKEYKDSINLNDHEINLLYNKNNLSIKGQGKVSFDNQSDTVSYEILTKDNIYKFKSQINLKNNLLSIDFLNYKQDKKNKSLIKFEGIYKKNDDIFFKNISLKESKNFFVINDLRINKNFKIKNINKFNTSYVNINNFKNEFSINKDKNKYRISGKYLDLSYALKHLLKKDKKNKKNNIKKYFVDLNENFEISLDQALINKSSLIKNLNGNINFKKNRLNEAYIQSNFNDNKNIIFTLRNNNNSERVITLTSDHAKPLVNNYSFIKGFEDGSLDFYSIKKNNKSRSKLIIYDFKLKELPALTQLLSLASLQGIADTLTGEGIRFQEFEMNFTDEDNLMNIEEIYAIGPAISILMSGYIEENKLVSLRGTLVPARTINKVIGSIPFLGKILVGKKTGEGVFGVSFKIKGSPKKLKTTVNPIKTLTPRFITRILKKIKKN